MPIAGILYVRTQHLKLFSGRCSFLLRKLKHVAVGVALAAFPHPRGLNPVNCGTKHVACCSWVSYCSPV